MTLQHQFVAFVEEKLGAVFAAKHLTLAAVCVKSAAHFCERSAAVCADAQKLAACVRSEASKKAKKTYTHDMSQYRGLTPTQRKKKIAAAFAERQNAQYMVNVIVNHELDRCVREWSCRALTALVYSVYVARSPVARLCDAPLAMMEIWLRDLKAQLSPALDAGRCLVSDISMVFERALLHRHMSFLPCALRTDQAGLLGRKHGSMSIKEFQQFAAANPHAAVKRFRRASRVCVEVTLSSEQVAESGDHLVRYSNMCCEELMHFSSGMVNIADRFNLSIENLMVLWGCYLFVVLQRGGFSMSENPYTNHMRAQVELFTQYAPLRASVLALRTRIDNCLDDWQREGVFVCGRELRELWSVHCNWLLQGLDATYFSHRMVRQNMAHRLAMTFLTPVNLSSGAVARATSTGKWQRTDRDTESAVDDCKDSRH